MSVVEHRRGALYEDEKRPEWGLALRRLCSEGATDEQAAELRRAS